MGIDDLVKTAKELAGKGKDLAGDLARKAKDVGGTLAGHAKRVAGSAKVEGSIGDKAKAAFEAVKHPGGPEPK